MAPPNRSYGKQPRPVAGERIKWDQISSGPVKTPPAPTPTPASPAAELSPLSDAGLPVPYSPPTQLVNFWKTVTTPSRWRNVRYNLSLARWMASEEAGPEAEAEAARAESRRNPRAAEEEQVKKDGGHDAGNSQNSEERVRPRGNTNAKRRRTRASHTRPVVPAACKQQNLAPAKPQAKAKTSRPSTRTQSLAPGAFVNVLIATGRSNRTATCRIVSAATPSAPKELRVQWLYSRRDINTTAAPALRTLLRTLRPREAVLTNHCDVVGVESVVDGRAAAVVLGAEEGVSTLGRGAWRVVGFWRFDNGALLSGRAVTRVEELDGEELDGDESGG